MSLNCAEDVTSQNDKQDSKEIVLTYQVHNNNNVHLLIFHVLEHKKHETEQLKIIS